MTFSFIANEADFNGWIFYYEQTDVTAKSKSPSYWQVIIKERCIPAYSSLREWSNMTVWANMTVSLWPFMIYLRRHFLKVIFKRTKQG